MKCKLRLEERIPRSPHAEPALDGLERLCRHSDRSGGGSQWGVPTAGTLGGAEIWILRLK